ncbi:MAG: zinc ABC transporter substrate-binding protein [Pirellulaceae bacterium]|nr:zinc ABC transporter substrate-binding protein [Pirellulaceae bacterium]
MSGCESPPATTGNAHEHRHARPAITSQFAGRYPIEAVCTTGMVADLVSNVGGTHVRASALMGAGVDPHLYKASPADVAKLDSADILFYSGWHLEGKLAELLARMGRRKPTIAAAEQIPETAVLHDEHGAADPHLWFDVSLWSQAASEVRDALCEFDPPHAADYRKNTDDYQARLAALHDYARVELASVPRERRVLVTAHDAFQYFGRAYDLQVRGIQGISTDSEAGVRQVNELVDFLVKHQIKAVFVETSVADANIRSLLEGAAAQGHTLRIGGELFSDAMGAAGTSEGTYEGMVRHNVDTIVKALK